MARESQLRTKAGRDDDFRAFATARTPHLYRTACLLAGGDTHLAEDLVQEALGRIYAQWHRTAWLVPRERIDNPAGYAHTVLVRAFLSHHGRRSSGERPVGSVPDSAARESDPALRLALVDALARLAPRDRAVLVLRFWEDRSVEQTAEVLRRSPGAVRTQTVRALGRIRAVLGDDLRELADH
ncbi:SigE family RNA polymerase sigma factor [Kitasatospora purpeofusca]|uniref:SigE family RNA polymerase sigma factor n=1 Tax=Kitasatospora purpeofusca TaxID=67352 RepID=UPI002A5AE593|nr:SigE family RNA polymerase sigma factor [Kitasatospora purpeofusca]MDY0810460.1 SigE family RNA polymerase sigma factor [Kitasatospora purpeofusca]